jgi:hypothetical protein
MVAKKKRRVVTSDFGLARNNMGVRFFKQRGNNESPLEANSLL